MGMVPPSSVPVAPVSLPLIRTAGGAASVRRFQPQQPCHQVRCCRRFLSESVAILPSTSWKAGFYAVCTEWCCQWCGAVTWCTAPPHATRPYVLAACFKLCGGSAGVSGADELVLSEVTLLLACCLTDKKDASVLLRTLKDQLNVTEDQAKVLYDKLHSAKLAPFEAASTTCEQVQQCQVRCPVAPVAVMPAPVFHRHIDAAELCLCHVCGAVLRVCRAKQPKSATLQCPYSARCSNRWHPRTSRAMQSSERPAAA